MRRIDLSNYDVDTGDTKIPYDVKDSLESVLYHTELRLGYRDLLDNDRVAQKIRKSNGFVLLEEAEYQRLKQAIESFHGYGKQDVELVRRVLESPEVEVYPA